MRHPTTAPAQHRAFLDRAVPLLASDARVAGIAAAGSYAQDRMDDFSDLDLVLACDAGDFASLMQDRAALARTLGPLVAAFTGEHVGEPRLLICLYGPPALHVDLKVLALGDLADRVDEPVVLWARDGRMAAAYASAPGMFPQPDAQWIEDRFWVWVHYGALKIARGELQEACDFLSYLRVTVLGPLGLQRAGLPPNGVRRVESDPALARLLAATVGPLERRALVDCLQSAIAAYHALRPAAVGPNRDAESVALDFLAEVRAGH
jgi:hypothetical protein